MTLNTPALGLTWPSTNAHLCDPRRLCDFCVTSKLFLKRKSHQKSAQRKALPPPPPSGSLEHDREKKEKSSSTTTPHPGPKADMALDRCSLRQPVTAPARRPPTQSPTPTAAALVVPTPADEIRRWYAVISCAIQRTNAKILRGEPVPAVVAPPAWRRFGLGSHRDLGLARG